MAKNSKKKKHSGLIAFLAAIAVILAIAMLLLVIGVTRGGSGGFSLKNVFSKQTADSTATGSKTLTESPAADAGAAVTDETSADGRTAEASADKTAADDQAAQVTQVSAQPVKNGDIISGVIYDPEHDIDLYNYDGKGVRTGNASQTAETAAEGTFSSVEAAQTESLPSGAEDIASADSGASDQAEESADSEYTLYVTADTVNVRASASIDGEKLGVAQRGERFTEKGKDGEWTMIDFNGQTAYIKSEFLSSEKPAAQVWDLETLSNEQYNFGYSNENRDENNIPTDWAWYESKWGQFDVDWIQDTSDKTIYLTMDEGFGNDNTIKILDTLAEKGVPVTFFVTKYFADERPELIERMLKEGHQIGNHTCTHPNMPSLGIEAETDQVMTLHNQIKDQFGYEMKLFRYPEGIYSDQSFGLVNNLGYKVVFWTYAYVDYNEDAQPPVDESLQKALAGLHNGAIYLLHASSDTNTAMLADFIDGARARGFEFGSYPS